VIKHDDSDLEANPFSTYAVDRDRWFLIVLFRFSFGMEFEVTLAQRVADGFGNKALYL